MDRDVYARALAVLAADKRRLYRCTECGFEWNSVEAPLCHMPTPDELPERWSVGMVCPGKESHCGSSYYEWINFEEWRIE